jgi:hypothetical protein
MEKLSIWMLLAQSWTHISELAKRDSPHVVISSMTLLKTSCRIPRGLHPQKMPALAPACRRPSKALGTAATFVKNMA